MLSRQVYKTFDLFDGKLNQTVNKNQVVSETDLKLGMVKTVFITTSVRRALLHNLF